MIELLSSNERNWDLLVYVVPLTAQDILDVTIEKGGEPEELAAHLDGRFPGIQESFARRYVEEAAKPLLEEVVPFNANTNEVLSNPRAFFRTGDEAQLAANCATNYFQDRVNKNSPPQVIRAMEAHIALGVGWFKIAVNSAAFAVCETKVKDFGSLLHVRAQEALDAVVATERRKAEILVELITDRRRQ